MKITCDAGALAKLLETAARAAANRSSHQILGAVLLEADAEASSLTVSATDMEVSARVRSKAPVQEGGKAAIPARTLTAITRSLPAGEATLQTTREGATLTSAKGSYSLRCYDAGEFPAIPAFPAPPAESAEGTDPQAASVARFTIPAKILSGVVEKVLPCVSKDTSRPALTGALLRVEAEPAKLTAVATDSYRMSVVEEPLQEAPAQQHEAIVPARGLKAAARLSSLAEEVHVALTKNAAMFEAGGVLIATRLIEGDFPAFEKLLPESFEREFSVQSAPLSEALGRVRLFAEKASPPVPARLSFTSSAGEGTVTGGELAVSVENAEIGAAKERVSAAVEGEDFEAAFNPAYLAEGVAASFSGTGKTLFSFNDPPKPAIISPDSSADSSGNGSAESGSFRYLIMPMRDPNVAGAAGEAGDVGTA